MAEQFDVKNGRVQEEEKKNSALGTAAKAAAAAGVFHVGQNVATNALLGSEYGKNSIAENFVAGTMNRKIDSPWYKEAVKHILVPEYAAMQREATQLGLKTHDRFVGGQVSKIDPKAFEAASSVVGASNQNASPVTKGVGSMLEALGKVDKGAVKRKSSATNLQAFSRVGKRDLTGAASNLALSMVEPVGGLMNLSKQVLSHPAMQKSKLVAKGRAMVNNYLLKRAKGAFSKGASGQKFDQVNNFVKSNILSPSVGLTDRVGYAAGEASRNTVKNVF